MLLSSVLASWWVLPGTFVLGESIVLSAAALAAQGAFPVWMVALWAFVGTVASDNVWFRVLGRAFSAVNRKEERAERLARHVARLDRVTGDHPHRALLFVKFIYGTRILSISYLAVRKVSTRTFAIFDAVGTLIWLAVIVPVGYAGGRVLDRIGVDLRQLQVGFVVVVVLAIGLRLVAAWRTRHREASVDTATCQDQERERQP